MARKSLLAALLALWALALLLPRPSGQQSGKPHRRWPPTSFAVYYGRWDRAKIAQAARYELLIAHPGKDLAAFNQDLVARLRSGPDGLPGSNDDRLLLAYLSVGEDEDPPRGPRDFLPRYLDEQRYILQQGFPAMGPDGLPLLEPGQDGIPDRNGAWGSYYVQPGDPEWRAMLNRRADRLAERGVDGFFLDTVDVPEARQTQMMELLEALRARFQRHYLVTNRGVGLLQRFPQRFVAAVDGVVLESWFTHWNWSWGRATLSPFYSENQRLLREVLLPHRGLPLFFLDYLDPAQPDRGALLARRTRPGFWSHPFLDRLESVEAGSGPRPAAPQRAAARRRADGLVEVAGLDGPCELEASGQALPGSVSPWAVGACRQLRLRRVEPSGQVSDWVELAVESGGPEWEPEWSVLELDTSLEVRWNGPQEAQLWLGDEPGALAPRLKGRSPLHCSGLTQDRLYWVSLGHPEGPPDPARPARTHDVTPPPTPGGVRARRTSRGYVQISWTPVSAPDLDGYRVYLSRRGGPLALPYEVRGNNHFEVAAPADELSLLVTSFDTGNHESRPGPRQDL